MNHPKDVVNEGDEITLRVIKVDVRNRRLGLSLKRVNRAEYLDLDLGRGLGRRALNQHDASNGCGSGGQHIGAVLLTPRG
ncbi:MAG: S1 RNA-binding domain-containing protein [Chloroflexi bacterium]|nr:S1 RNA-binding domain-containing protein [Chloroflexota bacterium]